MFLLNLVMSGTLSLMWNIFNTLQLETALPQLNISPPANVIFIGDKFDEIVNFKLATKEQIYQYVTRYLVRDIQIDKDLPADQSND